MELLESHHDPRKFWKVSHQSISSIMGYKQNKKKGYMFEYNLGKKYTDTQAIH